MMRRTTGATSGLIILVLGAWGALIPFIGPLFDFGYAPNSAWHWTTGRLWLSIIPGAVAVIGALMMMGSIRRGGVATGSTWAMWAGIWFVVGPVISQLWNHGVPQTGLPLHSGAFLRTMEQLAFHSGIGVVITALAGIALGRVTPYRVRAGTATTAGAAAGTTAAGDRVVGEREVDTAPRRRRGLLGRRRSAAAADDRTATY